MHTITLVSYSVLTVTSRLETVGKEKLEKKKRVRVCAKPLCHQASKMEDNQRRNPPSCKKQEQKGNSGYQGRL